MVSRRFDLTKSKASQKELWESAGIPLMAERQMPAVMHAGKPRLHVGSLGYHACLNLSHGTESSSILGSPT